VSQLKKVLAVIPYSYLPYYSGGQKLIAQFFDHLGRETDLTLVSLEGMDTTAVKSYRFIPLLKAARSRYYDFSLVKKISRLVKEEGIEAIIWEHPYYAWLAYRVKRKTGVRTIIQTQNIEYQRFRSLKKWWWPLLRMYEKWSFNMADFVFFITPEDKEFAEAKWHINPAKGALVPYGVTVNSNPTDRAACRKEVAATHHINDEEKIFLFNGVLSYQPNIDALKYILQHINPLLLQAGIKYKIIICGKGLAAEMNELKEYADQNIIYTGFVPDIDIYFKAADLLLNPVQSGGGIKTKMVEAIAFGTTVISTKSGAAGMDTTACGEKLSVVADNDWQGFTDEILKVTYPTEATPEAYYKVYNWGEIARKVVSTL
jgi:polysaccharide biosynthesis protein PslH